MKWGPVGGCGVRCRQIYRRCCCHYRVDRLQCPSDGRFFRFSTNSTEGLGRTESLGLIQHKELIQSSAESSEHVNTGHGESERERESITERDVFVPVPGKTPECHDGLLAWTKTAKPKDFSQHEARKSCGRGSKGPVLEAANCNDRLHVLSSFSVPPMSFFCYHDCLFERKLRWAAAAVLKSRSFRLHSYIIL